VDLARFEGVRDQLWLRFTWQEPDSLRLQRWPRLKKALKRILNPNKRLTTYQYSATANIALREAGKLTSTPPPPKKSALDKGPNSEARAVAQLRTNHWLSGVYLKRIKKRSHDGCWFCEPSHNSQDTPRMTRTHVLLRCVAFEEVRRETWTDPLTGEFTHPSSIGQLLGNPRWEKRLLKFLQHTKIGRIGPDLIDDEIRRVLYTNKLYSKILHPITDEVTMLQTSNTRSYTLSRSSNTRSYIILRASNTQSYITLRASNRQGYIILRTSNTRSYTCHGRVTYEVTNFHRRITHDHTRVTQQVHRYYY
jgi:hypothetical protein